jgi:hypothetical protein
MFEKWSAAISSTFNLFKFPLAQEIQTALQLTVQRLNDPLAPVFINSRAFEAFPKTNLALLRED